MANSVDPDQTAPSGAVWSGSALFACVILSETLVFEFLGHLPYLSYLNREYRKWGEGIQLFESWNDNMTAWCILSSVCSDTQACVHKHWLTI